MCRICRRWGPLEFDFAVIRKKKLKNLKDEIINICTYYIIYGNREKEGHHKSQFFFCFFFITTKIPVDIIISRFMWLRKYNANSMYHLNSNRNR